MRKNPRAFWLTAGGLGLAILTAAVSILFTIPEVRVLWHFSWGQYYYEKGQQDSSFYQKSLEEFDKAIRMSTDYDWLALVGRGTVQGKLDKSQEQLSDCKRATEENEEFALAWNCLGVALNALGQYGEAIAAFDKAIYWAQRNEGLGSTEKRIEVEIEATYNKGDALLNNKEPEQAIATLEGALKLAQNNQLENYYHFLYNLLARAYWEKKEYDRALDFYNLSISKSQYYYPAQLGKGLTLYYQEKPQEALDAFNQILINQDSYDNFDDFKRAEVWYYKGLVFEKLNQCQEAIAAYEKALQYRTDYQAAEEGRLAAQKRCQ